MAQQNSPELIREAASEVFTYGMRVDYVEVSFYVYDRYRQQIIDSPHLVDSLVQSLKDSSNYVKEKVYFLVKFRELITFN